LLHEMCGSRVRGEHVADRRKLSCKLAMFSATTPPVFKFK
jgi:hypothetical protein